jgi:chromosome segregation ATPase
VRIPGSRLVAVVILASFTLSACGSGGGDEALAAAQQRAEDALQGLGELERRTAELESELDDLRAEGQDVKSRLESLARKLNTKTEKLATSIAEASSSASSAAGEASDALGTASEAAREISILTNRLNYHLRNSGGE